MLNGYACFQFNDRDTWSNVPYTYTGHLCNTLVDVDTAIILIFCSILQYLSSSLRKFCTYLSQWKLFISLHAVKYSTSQFPLDEYINIYKRSLPEVKLYKWAVVYLEMWRSIHHLRSGTFWSNILWWMCFCTRLLLGSEQIWATVYRD